jgi:hypothetical protein
MVRAVLRKTVKVIAIGFLYLRQHITKMLILSDFSIGKLVDNPYW